MPVVEVQGATAGAFQPVRGETGTSLFGATAAQCEACS